MKVRTLGMEDATRRMDRLTGETDSEMRMDKLKRGHFLLLKAKNFNIKIGINWYASDVDGVIFIEMTCQ